MTTIGQRIKTAREQAGMTQVELAAKLGIPYQSISQWERGTRNPKPESLKRIAAALGTQPWKIDDFYNVHKNIADIGDALLQICGKSPDSETIQTEDLETEITSDMPLALDASDLAFLREIGDLSESDKALLLAMAKRLREAGREGSAAIQTSKGPYYLYSYPQETPPPSSEGKDTTPPPPPPESPENGG